MIHGEYATLNLFLIRKNRNGHPREENNCGDDYILFLTYDSHVCDTAFAEKTYIISNNIPVITYSVLSSTHIRGAKYMIYSIKYIMIQI